MDKLKGIHSTDLDSFRIKKTKKLKEKEKEVIDQYKAIKAEQEKTLPAALTDIQEKFVDFYCSRYGEWSAAQCAEAAGYGKKGSYARASELLDYKKNPQVHLEIQNRMAMLREQWAIDRDKHMAMLTKIRDEARIKGQYGVVAKCEELRGKAGGLYIEKSMVITKDIDKKADDEFRELYKTRADFEKSMILMAETMYPNEKSELYDDSTIELTEEEIEMRKRGEELDEYNKMRAKEREKLYKK